MIILIKTDFITLKMSYVFLCTFYCPLIVVTRHLGPDVLDSVGHDAKYIILFVD